MAKRLSGISGESDMEFVPVSEENVTLAAEVHAASWQESHKSFCTEAFVAQHTPQRQENYLRAEMAAGKRIWLLEDEDEPVGLVSVKLDGKELSRCDW